MGFVLYNLATSISLLRLACFTASRLAVKYSALVSLVHVVPFSYIKGSLASCDGLLDIHDGLLMVMCFLDMCLLQDSMILFLRRSPIVSLICKVKQVSASGSSVVLLL